MEGSRREYLLQSEKASRLPLRRFAPGVANIGKVGSRGILGLSTDCERTRERARIERSQWLVDKVIFSTCMNAYTASLVGGAIGMVIAGLFVFPCRQFHTSRRNQFTQVAVFVLASAMAAYLFHRF